MKKIMLSNLFLLFVFHAVSQVAVNTDGSTANASAILDVRSINKGALLPRMTTTQRKNIVSPAAGLLVFDTDKSCLYLFDGVSWQAMAFTSSNLVPPVIRVPSDAEAFDNFGTSVSLSGDYAIIGAENGDGMVSGSGCAYIFFRSGGIWTQQAKIFASNGTAFDHFGASVSISGDYVIIGTPNWQQGAVIDQGCAYIFVRSGTNWTQQAQIIASDGALTDLFGKAVSISGNRVAIGVPDDDHGGTGSQGSVYVFFRSGTNWIQQAKLTPSDVAAGDMFGTSVVLAGDDLIAGSPYDVIGGGTKGSVSIYSYNTTFGWVSNGKITCSDCVVDEYFGISVSLSGDYLAVGATNDQHGIYEAAGSVYVFLRSGGVFSEQEKLISPNIFSFERFGRSVAITPDHLVITSNGVFTEGIGTVYAFIYTRNGTNWDFLRKVRDPEGLTNASTNAAIAGFNVIAANPSANNSAGKVLFLNVEQ